MIPGNTKKLAGLLYSHNILRGKVDQGAVWSEMVNGRVSLAILTHDFLISSVTLF